MFIAFAAVICNLIIGVVYGGISGYFGGAVDNVMMRIIEIINGIPYLIVVILLMMILPPGLMTIVVAYATTGWTGMARLVRGQVISLKEQEFVVAAKALGANAPRLILRHLLPNSLSGGHRQSDAVHPQRNFYRGVPLLYRPGRTGAAVFVGHAGAGRIGRHAHLSFPAHHPRAVHQPYHVLLQPVGRRSARCI